MITTLVLPDPKSLADTYKDNYPFEHIVIDGLLEEEDVDTILGAWPTDWPISFDAPRERGKRAVQEFPEEIGDIAQRFLSLEFLRFLEELTGYSGLVADPTWRGGGLHDTVPGGYLKTHLDFNKYKGMERTLNLLLFLNRDWKEEYGGHLELWDESGPAVEVLPSANRAVIFTTKLKHSWHGHPRPHSAPMSRKSIAAYYYTDNDPETVPHGTLFRES